MVSIRKRYADATRKGKAEIAALRRKLKTAADLGDAGAKEELRILEVFEARAREDFGIKRKAA